MDNKKYLLTVCIPTYNRPSHIQKQVRDVLAQLTEGVRLLVMDNHSDVPTESYFTKEEEPEIVRNMAASGADMMFVAFSSPKKEYWIRRHLRELNIPFVI